MLLTRTTQLFETELFLVGYLYYPWPNCDENATTLCILKESHPLSWENLFKPVSENGVPPPGPHTAAFDGQSIAGRESDAIGSISYTCSRLFT